MIWSSCAVGGWSKVFGWGMQHIVALDSGDAFQWEWSAAILVKRREAAGHTLDVSPDQPYLAFIVGGI
jgi:hypothetical protein